jgi:integrase
MCKLYASLDMGRLASKDAVEIHSGVYLTKKQNFWQCYFRVGGTALRRSTKTKDFDDAKFIALGWYKEAVRRFESGEQIEAVSFARLKRSYLEFIKGQKKYDYHSQTIERHFLAFFAKFHDISKIKRTDILDYLSYRRAKGDKEATAQTINRENTVLRQMLKYAQDRGWLVKAVLIDSLPERHTRRRRRHFTADEYRVLYRTARKRIRELDGIILKTRQQEQRQLLLDYILLLSNTGLRVDEAGTLIWRNVDWDNETLLLEYAGKTKSSRRVLMRKGAVIALRRIEARRLAYLEEQGLQWNANSSIVALANGRRVHSLKKGFNELLEACGFVYEKIEDKHALTSLRHTYATFRLTTKTGKKGECQGFGKTDGHE